MVPMMTFEEIALRLREEGVPIGFRALKEIIKNGVFGPGCCVIELTGDKAFVPRKAVEDWIAAYTMEDPQYKAMCEFYGGESA